MYSFFLRILGSSIFSNRRHFCLLYTNTLDLLSDLAQQFPIEKNPIHNQLIKTKCVLSFTRTQRANVFKAIYD